MMVNPMRKIGMGKLNPIKMYSLPKIRSYLHPERLSLLIYQLNLGRKKMLLKINFLMKVVLRIYGQETFEIFLLEN